MKTTSCGTINKGGDKMAYLGHFRSPEVLKRGHNQGPPKKPTLADDAGYRPPVQSKAREATQALRQAKRAGAGADVTAPAWEQRQGARAEKKEAFKTLRQAKQDLRTKGAGEDRRAAVQAAKSNVKQNFHGAFKQRQAAYRATEKKKSGGGLFSKITSAGKKSIGM